MIALTSTNLLISQIISHVALAWLLINGSIQMWIICFIILFLSGCFGMTMTYHRLLSHRSWKINKNIEYIFSYLGGIGLTGSALSWVSTHRKHHRFTDKPNDPHSPIYKGWFYCHFLSMFSKVEIKYVRDLLKNKWYLFQHRYYFLLALSWGILMTILFWDLTALIYAWLAPSAILWNFGSNIVSISHRDKKIHNDFILSILVWGEGYHKNHHEHPYRYRFGKWDLAGIIINIIKSKS